MQLGPKDIFPTIVAAGAAYVGFLIATGRVLPWHISTRWMIAGLLVLGLIACATGASSTAMTNKTAFTIVMSTLGGLAILVGIVGIIKPSTLVVSILCGIILLLWVLTTSKRIIG